MGKQRSGDLHRLAVQWGIKDHSNDLRVGQAGCVRTGVSAQHAAPTRDPGPRPTGPSKRPYRTRCGVGRGQSMLPAIVCSFQRPDADTLCVCHRDDYPQASDPGFVRSVSSRSHRPPMTGRPLASAARWQRRHHFLFRRSRLGSGRPRVGAVGAACTARPDTARPACGDRPPCVRLRW